MISRSDNKDKNEFIKHDKIKYHGLSQSLGPIYITLASVISEIA